MMQDPGRSTGSRCHHPLAINKDSVALTLFHRFPAQQCIYLFQCVFCCLFLLVLGEPGQS